MTKKQSTIFFYFLVKIRNKKSETENSAHEVDGAIMRNTYTLTSTKTKNELTFRTLLKQF